MTPLLPPLLARGPLTLLDETASAMERKWGIGRLLRLVPPELAAKFQGAGDMLDAEWEFASVDRRDALQAMMIRAWMALDAAATTAGAEPLPPGLWETPDPVAPGGVVVVCRDEEHAHTERLRAVHDGRAIVTYTLAEVANVMAAHRMPLVNDIKRAWPGATVLPPRERSKWQGDDLVPDIAAEMAQ